MIKGYTCTFIHTKHCFSSHNYNTYDSRMSRDQFDIITLFQLLGLAHGPPLVFKCANVIWRRAARISCKSLTTTLLPSIRASSLCWWRSWTQGRRSSRGNGVAWGTHGPVRILCEASISIFTASWSGITQSATLFPRLGTASRNIHRWFGGWISGWYLCGSGFSWWGS